jgi:hypothetical protein
MTRVLHFFSQHFIAPGQSKSSVQAILVDGDFGHIPGFAAALAHLQISQPRLSFTNPNWQYIMHITGLHAKRNENAHFNAAL